MQFIRPCKAHISSLFGPRIHPVTGEVGKPHWGVDYGNDVDNTIVAAQNGKVVRARNAETDGYGKLVIIEHIVEGELWSTVYAHLASISIREGATVRIGQKIGVKGTTGVSTGIHLHFEVHKGKWNNKFTNAVNPLFHVYDPDIKVLQQQLKDLGYRVDVDGIYGSSTVKAVIAFQKSRGLGADGVAGNSTRHMLALNPGPSKPKEEEIKMYNPSSKAIKDSTAAILVKMENEKENPLSGKWRERLEAGTLSESDATGLLYVALDRYVLK